MKAFSNYPTGVSGYWYGMVYVMSLVERCLRSSSLITSAHLYFGVLENLEMIVQAPPASSA